MIATDLTKEQALNPDPYAMQQINFIGNLDREGNRQSFPLLKKQHKHF